MAGGRQAGGRWSTQVLLPWTGLAPKLGCGWDKALEDLAKRAGHGRHLKMPPGEAHQPASFQKFPPEASAAWLGVLWFPRTGSPHPRPHPTPTRPRSSWLNPMSWQPHTNLLSLPATAMPCLWAHQSTGRVPTGALTLATHLAPVMGVHRLPDLRAPPRLLLPVPISAAPHRPSPTLPRRC